LRSGRHAVKLHKVLSSHDDPERPKSDLQHLPDRKTNQPSNLT
jgi:hypothetical protein